MTKATNLELESRSHQELSALLGNTLADAELRFQAVVESLAEGLAIFDTTGVLVYCNSGFEQITGYMREEMYGKRVYEIFYPPGSPEQDLYFKEMLERYRARQRGVVETYRTYIYRKNGERRCIETKAGPFRDVNGNIIGSIGANTDITEKARLEEQLQLAHRLEAAQSVAAGVAVNFGDLLTTLSGQTEILLADADLGENARLAAQSIDDGVAAARRLTRHLLLTTRPPALRIESVDLNELLRESAEVIRGIVGDSFTLEIGLTPDTPPVAADSAYLHQALVSLILYLRKIFGHGGRVLLAAARQDFDTDVDTDFGSIATGRYSALLVEHTGQRINGARALSLFKPSSGLIQPDERFLRSEIELWSCYSIIRLLGGQLCIDESADGKCAFAVFLPVAEAGRTAQPPAMETDTSLSGAEEIIVAEDNAPLAAYIAGLLARNGYQASCGPRTAGPDQVHSGRTKLVIASVGVHEDPLEITRNVAALNPGTRLLLLSGSTWDTDTMEELESLGAASLLKPFAPVELLKAVRRLLDKKLTVRLRTAG